MGYLSKELHYVDKVMDYGVTVSILKANNRILGWVEPYPQSTAVDEERGKYFYSVGNPNKQRLTQYTVDTREEGMNALKRIFL